MALVPPHTHPRHEHSQYLTLADASAAGLFVPLAGGTMTGKLVISLGAQVLDLKAGATDDHVYMAFYADSQAQTVRSAFFGYGVAGSNQLSLYNEMANGDIVLGTNGTGRVAVSGDPTSALHVATKQYVDTADAGKAAASHTHSYLPLSGGTVTGNTIFSNAGTSIEARGIYLHHPGVDHVRIESGSQSGVPCLTVLDPDGSTLRPVRIGSPINGESAARVDWVRSDRAAASHGTHIGAAVTVVVTTDGAGNVSFNYGSGTPVVSNGDWNAMQRAPHIGGWGGGVVTVMNLNANAICRLNVLGA